jgi:hypothetical protein
VWNIPAFSGVSPVVEASWFSSANGPLWCTDTAHSCPKLASEVLVYLPGASLETIAGSAIEVGLLGIEDRPHWSRYPLRLCSTCMKTLQTNR